jgi:PAS domain S-box-containing protein
MIQGWMWIVLAALVVLVGYQRLRFNEIQRQSKNREELFQIVAENAADMIALVDMKGRRLYYSLAYKKILGYSPAELGETSSFGPIHPENRFEVLETAREARQSGVGKKMEYRIRHKDGSWKVLESLASVVRDEKGEVVKLVIVNRDITERRSTKDQLEHNSYHDALTGLPNRRLGQGYFSRRRSRPAAQKNCCPGNSRSHRRVEQWRSSAGNGCVSVASSRRGRVQPRTPKKQRCRRQSRTGYVQWEQGTRCRRGCGSASCRAG